jgi:hypothetical protein
VPSIATVEGTQTLAAAAAVISSKGACKGDFCTCFFEAKLAKKSQSLGGDLDFEDE